MLEQEVDVLVCTTIIETGVDLPNANTLIIENADCMGLSQLHQLRGRVGRSSRRAYAYFTFRRSEVLTDIQLKRLAAIREYTEFGSGFKIAMRDLELRGAGISSWVLRYSTVTSAPSRIAVRAASMATFPPPMTPTFSPSRSGTMSRVRLSREAC